MDSILFRPQAIREAPTVMRQAKFTFHVIWALAILPSDIWSFCHAATYHVAKTGDNSNVGTRESSLLTISRAAELAAPGDTILVHEGVYRERVAPLRGGEPGKRITYMAAAGERVILKVSEEWTADWKQALPRPGKVSTRTPTAISLRCDLPRRCAWAE